ncbi:unnamed protein product [Chrysodeixis includens]|uniref:Uncharacterized protein n=1 Tax=Chrysodeixis includens TaxID=689277 RepID=A0A9N8Q238_CHRIL|nr:unnamed protein product [Chrysodeixis includens]
MADKTKPSVPVARNALKTSTTTSRRPVSAAATTSAKGREKPITRPKKTSNPDAEVLKSEFQGLPDFDSENRQIAYGKFVRAMLEECLVDEKFEREETIMDLQMAQLAERFQKTMDQLDKTNQRLKDISFVVEQTRLVNLKSDDNSSFYEMNKNSNIESILKDLAITEQASLDRIQLKNIDFGYNKETGHKQLLDAVNDAIQGLEQIKKESNLDIDKFKEYEKSQISIEEMEKDRFDLDSLKASFEEKFPKFSEQLLKEMSDKIARMIIDDDEDNEDANF